MCVDKETNLSKEKWVLPRSSYIYFLCLSVMYSYTCTIGSLELQFAVSLKINKSIQ